MCSRNITVPRCLVKFLMKCFEQFYLDGFHQYGSHPGVDTKIVYTSTGLVSYLHVNWSGVEAKLCLAGVVGFT